MNKPVQLAILCLALAAASRAWPQERARTAIQYLSTVMDQFHKTYDVYTDVDAAGNHFAVRARMSNYDNARDSTAAGNAVPAMDESYPLRPHSGATCIQARFQSRLAEGAFDWGAWYFMNGVQKDGETRPNWGREPDAGIDLKGATRLTFWARGEKGGERVEFFALGVGWNPDDLDPRTHSPHVQRDPLTGKPFPHHDSSSKVGTGFVTLSPEWTSYSLDLRRKDLKYVLGGFGWASSAVMNGLQPITFYMDDIRYELDEAATTRRLQALRFLVSYQTEGVGDFDNVMRNAAHTYDNALALLAFLAADQPDRARAIADALVYAQANDRFQSPFYDGSLRNAYQAGDLTVPAGWVTLEGRANTVRMPGWYRSNMGWLEDPYCVSLDTGNMAWAMLALLAYHEQVVKSGESPYLLAAIRIGEWIERNCRCDPGYFGGFSGWEPHPKAVPYKATEHNIDLYAAFERLYRITGNPTWHERSCNALRFVRAMWDTERGMFWTGSARESLTPNKEVVPLDIQAWAVLSLRGEQALSSADKRRALQYVEDHMRIKGGGYDYSRRCDQDGLNCQDRQGVWYEGTAQMAVAYQQCGDPVRAREAITVLESAQRPSGGMPASNRNDGLPTGFQHDDVVICYYNRVHVGATAWLVFAELGVNPYWIGNK